MQLGPLHRRLGGATILVFILTGIFMRFSFPALYGEFWPAEKRLTRLHAMGYDAYHLVGGLYPERTGPMEEIIGATGTLYLEPDGKIHRRLAWARFERGQPVPLPAVVEFNYLFDRPGPGARFSRPSRWQSSQPLP